MERENSTVHDCIDIHLEPKTPVTDEEVDFDQIPVQLVRFQGELANSSLNTSLYLNISLKYYV